MSSLTFAPVQPDHLDALAEILNYYIRHTNFTFHNEIVQPGEMEGKVFFAQSWHKAFTIENEGELVGYCAIGPWKQPDAYRHSAEVCIYLRQDQAGKGLGKRALAHLEDFARQNDIDMLVAAICAENIHSIRMFEKEGFMQCARFKNIVRKFGRVLDTVYFQKAVV